MMKKKCKMKVVLLSLIMIFLASVIQVNAALVTSAPDLCNEPSGDWAMCGGTFINCDYITFGEEGGECVMSVPQAPTEYGSAFNFYLAANGNPPVDVVELEADLMLENTDNNSNLFIELKRNLPDGTAVEIRGYISNSFGQAVVQGNIHYFDKFMNPHSFALEEKPAYLDQFYSFKIVADGELVTISVDDIPLVSWNYDYGFLGQWVSGSATIAGESDTDAFSSKVKNVQAKYYDSQPTVEERLEALISTVESYGFKKGIEKSLVKKLESALRSYEKGRYDASSNKMGAFINHVEAQTGKNILENESIYLISEAEAIIGMIGN
ncbi:MAG: hypothetical protein U5R49_08720 [Deltaproteobacteria bacterium]|nr:hypothetical protein [Deltaproteobacteria bacterium]